MKLDKDWTTLTSTYGVSEIQLEKRKFATMLQISEEQFEFLAGTSSTDFFYDRLTLMLKAYIWGEDLGEVVIKYPATWWDAFKEQYVPYWLMQYPVRYVTVRANQYVDYPGLRLPSLKDTRVYRLKIPVRIDE